MEEKKNKLKVAMKDEKKKEKITEKLTDKISIKVTQQITDKIAETLKEHLKEKDSFANRIKIQEKELQKNCSSNSRDLVKEIAQKLNEKSNEVPIKINNSELPKDIKNRQEKILDLIKEKEREKAKELEKEREKMREQEKAREREKERERVKARERELEKLIIEQKKNQGKVTITPVFKDSNSICELADLLSQRLENTPVKVELKDERKMIVEKKNIDVEKKVVTVVADNVLSIDKKREDSIVKVVAVEKEDNKEDNNEDNLEKDIKCIIDALNQQEAKKEGDRIGNEISNCVGGNGGVCGEDDVRDMKSEMSITKTLDLEKQDYELIAENKYENMVANNDDLGHNIISNLHQEHYYEIIEQFFQNYPQYSTFTEERLINLLNRFGIEYIAKKFKNKLKGKSLPLMSEMLEKKKNEFKNTCFIINI